jgi:cell division septation protein DedD
MKILRHAVAAAVLLALFGCANPEADWQKAEVENTEAAYQAFIEKYPDGEWAAKAQAQLEALKDAKDWENAQTADTVEAYDNYLIAHPAGVHMGEARQRIGELELEAAWSAAQQTGTKEALEDFVSRYPDAPQAEQARSQIAALNPPPPPPPPPKPKVVAKPAAKSAKKPAATTSSATPGGSVTEGQNYQVQLGAFSSMDKARSEKTRLEKAYGRTIGTLLIQQPINNDGLYRLKSSGSMAESVARSACKRLQGAGEACMVVKR